jgi:NitT/TauT family transport system substrate-binding protein
MGINKLKKTGSMALCLAMVLWALAAAPAGAEPVPVRMMLQWTHQAQFAGYYVALEKGFYRDRELDVTIVPGGPGLDAADFLVRGEVDFASLWLVTALSRSEHELPLVNVAQIVNSSNLVLIAGKKSGIAGPADLSGKKISIWGGDFSAPYLAWFQAEKIRADIYPQYYSVNLFLRGGVDACSAMSYNEVHMLYQAGVNPDEVTVFFLRDNGFGFPEDGVYATQKMVGNDPKRAEAFRAASLAGWLYAAENPDEALDIVMKYVQETNVPTNRPHMKWMLEKILSSIVPGVQDHWVFGSLSRKDYETTVRIMRQQGLITGAPSYENFIGWGLGYVP